MPYGAWPWPPALTDQKQGKEGTTAGDGDLVVGVGVGSVDDRLKASATDRSTWGGSIKEN
jgi:hypothetical protein